jgi:transposase
MRLLEISLSIPERSKSNLRTLILNCRMCPTCCIYLTSCEGMSGLSTISVISATIFLAEIGDLSRFASPRQLMAYLGLVPGEESMGDRVWRGGITKAGNHRARRILVECSWSYRHPPRVGKKKLAKVEAAPPAVQEIAWKAQARLTARYRALARRGKRPTLVVTAIARELSGFIWAVSRAVSTPAVPTM